MKKDQNIKTYSLKNNHMELLLTNLGATILAIKLETDNGIIDVVLGHDNIETYRNNPGGFGAVIGRNANRIANATLNINNHNYTLDKNDGDHNLHSGTNGLQYQLYDIVEQTENSITFKYLMPHLEDKFPGDLYVEVTYTLTNSHDVIIEYRAKSDRDTVVNLTNHSYFNLNGHDSGDILDHLLFINADFYSPNNTESLPTGEVLSVNHTAFDFTTLRPIRSNFNLDDDQLKMLNGYDNNFMFNGEGFRPVATLKANTTNIEMTVSTDRPAMHLYTGNHMPDGTVGKGNYIYQEHPGICFETQTVANAVNMPWLKSPRLKANETYKTKTSFTFKF